MRYAPEPSVTTVCSPWRAEEVAVTTTSARGFLVAASTTRPVRTPLPCANAGLAASRPTSATELAGKRWAARQRKLMAAQRPRFLSRRFTGSSRRVGDLDDSEAPYTVSGVLLSIRTLLVRGANSGRFSGWQVIDALPKRLASR